MEVAVLTVGDELLAGDVTDTNAAWLARQLTERGATVRRLVTVPDEVDVIADAVASLAASYDAVVVTGGLGPTHDDVTLDGVAAALDRELVEHPDAVAALAERGYDSAELVEGTAHLPAGARVIPNDEGVAPGAAIENVYVLPGVPAEMRATFGAVAGEFAGRVRHVVVLETDEPESALVDRLAAVGERFDVTVGSYPGETVRLKLSGTDAAAVERAADWLRERVAVLGASHGEGEAEGGAAVDRDSAQQDGQPAGDERQAEE